MNIWEKFKKLEEYENQNNDKFKTFRVQKEYYLKQLPYQTDEEKFSILGKIEIMKNEIKIYDIIEEEFCVYVLIECENEQLNKFDNLFNNSSFHCESTVKGQGKYSKLFEIKKLYDKGENKIVKIDIINNNKKVKGTGFFFQTDQNLNLPFSKALITTNYVLNENFLISNNEIDLKYKNENTSLNIEDAQVYTIENFDINKKNFKRKIFTDPILDFTCIELFEDDFDGQFELFKIKEKNSYEIKNQDIFVLQFPLGEDLSFSLGKVLAENNYIFGHNASTDEGSSGSPILIRNELNVIGMHIGGYNIINHGYFIKDIMLYIKSIFSNIDAIKKEINIIKNDYSINKNNNKYLKQTIIKQGDIGFIFEAINENQEKILIIEINLIKLYTIINSEENFLDKIKQKIKHIINYSNNFEIFLEGNSLKIVLNKYEQRFIEYFTNNKEKLNNYEIYVLIRQLEQQFKNNSKIVKYFYPEDILIGNKNKMINYFIFYFNPIIGVKENNLYKDLNLSPKLAVNWIIGLFLYYLTMKGKYPFNLTNSKDIIKNIKNGKEIPLDENNIFSSTIINLLKKYEFNKEWDELEIPLNQNSMIKEEKDFCVNNRGSICSLKFNETFQTGFFCKLNVKTIPFKKALITFDNIGQVKSIIIHYLKNNKMIQKEINLNKRQIIRKNDCLFIQLLDNDDIDNFLEIEEKNLKKEYESNDIFILQYGIDKDYNKNFSFSNGKIFNSDKNYILHNIPTIIGALGSPIILRCNHYYVIGIHEGCMYNCKYNKRAINLYSILQDL